MFRQILALSLLLTCSAGTPVVGEEFQVRWEIDGGAWKASNRLPPDATVTLTTTTPDFTAELKVNGEKFTTKKKGDVFQGKVDKDGNLKITVAYLSPFTDRHVTYGLTWGDKNGLVGFSVRVSK